MFNSILNDVTIASISFMDELICIVVAFFFRRSNKFYT